MRKRASVPLEMLLGMGLTENGRHVVSVCLDLGTYQTGQAVWDLLSEDFRVHIEIPETQVYLN